MLVLTVLAGCGRFGYELHPFDHNHGGATPAGNDAGAGGDGDAPPDDLDAGAQPPVDGGHATLEDAGHAGDVDAGMTPRADAGALSDASTTAGDAGMPPVDAGQSQGEPFPLPSSVDCSSYASVLSCSSFDSAQLDPDFTTYQESGGRVRVAQGFVSSTTSTDSQVGIVKTHFNARTSGNVYLRFSMYVPSAVSIKGLNVAELGDPDNADDFGLDLDLADQGQVQVYVSGSADSLIGNSNTIPRDQWMCVLMAIEGVSRTGAVRVQIDGVDFLSESNVDTIPPGGVVGAAVGIDWTYDNQADTKIYVDNVVLAAQDPGNCT